MKVREMLKKMKKQGWYFVEDGTNHEKWAHDLYEYEWIPVPRHYSDDLKKSTEESIKKAMKNVEQRKKGE
ncbi:MAG: type II toxin-antitoxin system HicA family toxin [Candidatus Eremiobacteraeota bacterium]|nr:type II toxin-antitoxin system HicA family toxin [Candidatus Eremiobacteraeota bacterium]